MQGWHVVVMLFYSSIVIDALDISRFDLNQWRRRRQTEGGGCTLPYYPEHGQWKVVNGVGDEKPGEVISENSLIKYDCSPGYRLSAENRYLVCDETWSARFPDCERVCPPLYPSTTFTLQCRNRRGKEIKCSEATEGTYVEYSCVSSYETPPGYKKNLLCTDGKWSQQPICHPVCGKKIEDDAKTLIVGPKPSEFIEYPWVVALYKRSSNNTYKYICGGSILSLTVVLTAAHCVSNDFGDTLPKEQFSIGVGKLYSKYQASQDKNAQYLELSKIIVHDDYKGDSRRFLADIAVLVVKGEIVLNKVVQPVCFNNVNSIYLHPGSMGEVSAWGKADENEDTSEILRTLKAPYKDYETCAEELPKNWANKFSISDKICAGYFNKNQSVCDGDSGSGLAFVNLDDNRYYVHGIVSLGPQKDGHCDIQQNTLYTKVSVYYEYIDRLLTTYAPIIKDCVLPRHPKNGKWTNENKDLKPGDPAPSSTVLQIECKKGFKLSSVSNNINCGSAHSMPICQPLCPPLKFPNGATFRCTNKNSQTIDCLEAIEGSKLFYSCPKGYKVADGTTNNRTCTKGSWGLPQPECARPIKVCGRSNISSTLVDAKAEGLEHPWNVNLYEKENDASNTFVCGGSLISQKVILTGAICVTDSNNGAANPKEKYLVGVGMSYTKYRNPKDVNAQYSELSDIIIHQRYRGESRSFLADLAVLIVEKAFTLNNFVQPVCFFDVDSIHLRRGNVGVVLKYDDEDKQKALKIPYKDDNTCTKELPPDFADKYFLIDKICAGYANESSLCRGDSGKGYFFKNPEDDRYYIYGIVSVNNIENEKCHRNVLYTSVQFYYDFIDDILSLYT